MRKVVGGTIKVLVVDDSAFARIAISRELDADAEIKTIGTACNGVEALKLVKELEPDVVTLDIEMPVLNGLKTLERIMAEKPTPVIMLSSYTTIGSEATIKALELGAIDFFLKSSHANPAGGNCAEDDLKTKVKLAARCAHPKTRRKTESRSALPNIPILSSRRLILADRVVVIGSSTGGPEALCQIIPRFPPDIPAAVVIVQHMPPVFTRSLSNRLNQLSEVSVKEAEPGDLLRNGQVFVAPGDYHLVVEKGGKIKLNQEPAILGLRPAINVTMESVANLYQASAIGVVLTGMGTDGTLGAKAIRNSGGRIIAQDEDTSVVYGMPRSLVENVEVDKIVPLHGIAREIERMLCEIRR